MGIVIAATGAYRASAFLLLLGDREGSRPSARRTPRPSETQFVEGCEVSGAGSSIGFKGSDPPHAATAAFAESITDASTVQRRT